MKLVKSIFYKDMTGPSSKILRLDVNYQQKSWGTPLCPMMILLKLPLHLEVISRSWEGLAIPKLDFQSEELAISVVEFTNFFFLQTMCFCLAFLGLKLKSWLLYSAFQGPRIEKLFPTQLIPIALVGLLTHMLRFSSRNPFFQKDAKGKNA